jgi:pimeloyl-ACP methyl ester carboxylesterase
MRALRETLGDFDVRIWQGGGRERPLLYLHEYEQHPGAAPFLAKLGERHAVRAPEHPGYGRSTGFEHVEDVFDVTLHYRRLLERWNAGPVDVIGHGLGGMFAAELAAIAPQLVRRLVLVSPYGLWLDDTPMPDPFVLNPAALAKMKWHDPEKAGSEPSAFDAADGETIATFRAQNLSTATKFLWPIPDRGLKRRLQYVAAPTLIVRGVADGLFPAPYVDAWTAAIAGARAATIADAGHLPMVEAEDAFVATVEKFLS